MRVTYKPFTSAKDLNQGCPPGASDDDLARARIALARASAEERMNPSFRASQRRQEAAEFLKSLGRVRGII
jgi:hypothetical protein